MLCSKQIFDNIFSGILTGIKSIFESSASLNKSVLQIRFLVNSKCEFWLIFLKYLEIYGVCKKLRSKIFEKFLGRSNRFTNNIMDTLISSGVLADFLVWITNLTNPRSRIS